MPWPRWLSRNRKAPSITARRSPNTRNTLLTHQLRACERNRERSIEREIIDACWLDWSRKNGLSYGDASFGRWLFAFDMESNQVEGGASCQAWCYSRERAKRLGGCRRSIYNG